MGHGDRYFIPSQIVNTKLRCHLEGTVGLFHGRSVSRPRRPPISSVFRQPKNPEGLFRP